MSLTSGTRLGPYEIQSPLGAGGMGEVYRARDTRLDRTVAIKVLPSQFASDPDLRERFEREARAVAALNHPHICTLHDIGETDLAGGERHAAEKVQFLVLEYLDGETLAARLARGPLAFEQALQYAIQIADALNRAHRAGIVHRDLKPGNIMLTKSGAKLLDFGLAKTTAPAVAGSAVSMLPTTPPSLTAQGTILGTFQYMAPEQIEGFEADARTDIFAFGAVLHEMLTGKRAFEGKTQASLIGAILERQPPGVSTLQPLAPHAIDHIVRTCLAKSPDDRFQTAHDLLLQLRWIAEGGTTAGEAPLTATTVGRRRMQLAWFTAGCLGLTAAVLAAMLVRSSTRSRELPVAMNLAIVPPEKTNVGPGFAISPDGSSLVLPVDTLDGKNSLSLRPLDSDTTRPLKAEGGQQPFWSPDGRFIAFSAGGKLKKIGVPDGSPQTLCDLPVSMGGTWSRDDVILFVPSFGQSIFRVSASGGTPSPATKIDSSKESAHEFPRFLPDGRHYLYFVRSARRDVQGIYLGSLDATTGVRLLDGDTAAEYVAPGYLVFGREGALLAQPFDASTGRVSGEATTIAPSLEIEEDSNRGAFSVSDNGYVAYRTARQFRSQAVWVDESGHDLQAITADTGSGIALAPDERRLAVTRQDVRTATADVWLIDLSRGTSSRVSSSPRNDSNAIWAPDGSRLVFQSDHGTAGYYDLYEKPSTGGAETIVLTSDSDKQALDWSRDGRFLLYQTFFKTTRQDLFVLPLSGDRKPIAFLQTIANERDARFSPDGRWIAYVSDESGQSEVYAQPFPPTGATWQVSVGGGASPRWGPNGEGLFYESASQKLMSVTISYKPAFDPASSKPLFDLERVTDYSVSRDGRRFLINRVVSDPASGPINIILNWTAKLRN